MDAKRKALVRRNMRIARWVNGVASAAFVGTGLFFVLTPARRDTGLAVGLGVFFLLLGGSIAMWVWRGNWTPPDATRHTREMVVVDRIITVAGGFDLLVLSLALLGLIFSDLLGEYWRTHRLLVALACAAVVLDLVGRLIQRHAGRGKRHEDSEVSS